MLTLRLMIENELMHCIENLGSTILTSAADARCFVHVAEAALFNKQIAMTFDPFPH